MAHRLLSGQCTPNFARPGQEVSKKLSDQEQQLLGAEACLFTGASVWPLKIHGLTFKFAVVA